METPNEHDMLDAFADGELDEAQHADAAERFRKDTESRAYAEDVLKLKRSLTSMWASESAPTQVRERVGDALARADSAQAASAGVDLQDAKLPRSAWSPRRVSMFMTAAAVVLAATVWQLWPEKRTQSVQLDRMSLRDVSSAIAIHRSTATSGLNANERIAAVSEDEAQRTLSKALDITVLAPDLGHHGFAFTGARQCVVEGLPAAHVVYRHDASRLTLSLFSIPKLEKLRPRLSVAGVLDVFEARDKDLTTLAWHVGPATYVACTALPTVELLPVLGLPTPTARADLFQPDQETLVSLVMGEVLGYDTSRSAADPVAQPESTRSVGRRPPVPTMADGAKWIVLIRRAIVMGCS